jgi:hypothetical protein
VVNTTVSKRRIELPSTCRLVGTAAQREREEVAQMEKLWKCESCE